MDDTLTPRRRDVRIRTRQMREMELAIGTFAQEIRDSHLSDENGRKGNSGLQYANEDGNLITRVRLSYSRRYERRDQGHAGEEENLRRFCDAWLSSCDVSLIIVILAVIGAEGGWCPKFWKSRFSAISIETEVPS